MEHLEIEEVATAMARQYAGLVEAVDAAVIDGERVLVARVNSLPAVGLPHRYHEYRVYASIRIMDHVTGSEREVTFPVPPA